MLPFSIGGEAQFIVGVVELVLGVAQLIVRPILGCGQRVEALALVVAAPVRLAQALA